MSEAVSRPSVANRGLAIEKLLSSRHRAFYRKSSYIVSIPKSGRTWLRGMLNDYYCLLNGQDTPLNPDEDYFDGRPSYRFTHDRYEHITKASAWGRLRRRYLIPGSLRSRRRVLLLVRDLRDVMVSLYFQNVNREKNGFRGSVSEMIRGPRHGIDVVVSVLNGWIAEWGGAEQFMLVSYEDMRRATQQKFGRVLRFLGDENIDEALLARAVEENEFSAAQRRELQASGAKGIESLKARRGVVGGYVDFLDEDDLAYIDQAFSRLDPRLRSACAGASSST